MSHLSVNLLAKNVGSPAGLVPSRRAWYPPPPPLHEDLERKQTVGTFYRVVQNFEWEKFIWDQTDYCSLGQKYPIDLNILKIGQCLDLVVCKQSFIFFS